MGQMKKYITLEDISSKTLLIVKISLSFQSIQRHGNLLNHKIRTLNRFHLKEQIIPWCIMRTLYGFLGAEVKTRIYTRISRDMIFIKRYGDQLWEKGHLLALVLGILLLFMIIQCIHLVDGMDIAVLMSYISTRL